MPKTIFNVSDELMKQIERVIKKWGFESRAEFFRFTAIDFIRNEARFMPADDVLKNHTKIIKSVKARQILRKIS